MSWLSLVAGRAEGEVLVLEEPLSFWGGVDASTGTVIDAHHPQYGESISGRVVAMPFSRGSSSTANTLAESIHRGTGPAAIVLLERDEILVLGAVVAGELYDEWCPVGVVDEIAFRELANGQRVTVTPDGIEPAR